MISADTQKYIYSYRALKIKRICFVNVYEHIYNVNQINSS